jgi:hypothetical protein
MSRKAKQTKGKPAQAQPGVINWCGPALNVTVFHVSGLEEKASGASDASVAQPQLFKKGMLCKQKAILKIF